MARPTAQALNRNPGVSSDRTTAAPGLAVQAPLSVNVGGNSMQALADILGVGAGMAINRAAADSAERVKAEDELKAAQAEAQFYSDEVDPEQFKKSRIYRRRVQSLTGAREGVEASITLQNDFKQWVEENPYADENAARDWLASRKDSLLRDQDGNPKSFMGDEIANSIAQASLNETAYKLIAGHRAGYESRIKKKGGDEAIGLFMAETRKNGTTTVGNLENTRALLRSLDYTDEEANTALTNAALVTARETGNTAILDALPAVWRDGALGPQSSPESLNTINTQRSVITSQNEAKRIEALKPQQLGHLGQMDDKIRQGLPITEEDMKTGLELGFSPQAIAGWRDQSIRTAEALAEKARKEAEKEAEHGKTVAEIRANPWSFTTGKIEEELGIDYDAAVKAGDGRAAMALIREAVQYNALPMSLRNRLGRVPANPRDFSMWRKDMATIDNLDDQVFLSLPQDARSAYTAANALQASGRFTEEQIYQRLQSRDTERGRKYVQSKPGQTALRTIVGADAGTAIQAKANELLETFASFPDINDTEVVSMAQAAFKKNYYVEDGRIFDRALVRGKEDTNYYRIRYAADRTKLGKYTEPDDVVIAQIPGSSDIMFTIRGEPSSAQIIPIDDLRNTLKRDSDAFKKERDAPKVNARAAIQQNLNPWRYEPGENGLQRQQRAGRENEARRAAGLPVFPTPISWENANRK